MSPAEPQLAISSVLDAPRGLVFRAFTDPDHLATWWGPSGNTLLRDEIEFDVRPGGFQRWTEVSAAQPDLRVHIHIDLTDVADADLLEGVMHVTGRLQDDVEPFETRFRVEFHDEPDGRTRLEIQQWLPAHLAGPSNQGWLEALEKLDATLLHIQAAATDARCSGMATLIYATNVSLDGYIEDAHGAFDWAPPDDDVFAATTALLRSVGTFLYGRRLYETMAGWETNPALAEQSDLTA